MGRFIKKRTNTIGLPPGSIVYIGEKKIVQAALSKARG